ncbi:hypothetical protein A3Q56_06065 [Intoshia linei]|uniref:Large ribosomal subunit protein uL23 N-terminal domain-containing protein n=1 Tax=Intoshia linei TaxID=1819745 RepID=A0A177AVX8_9BILA|nr:hypothetical protein A3Q56_06065 [Intoshia linei]
MSKGKVSKGKSKSKNAKSDVKEVNVVKKVIEKRVKTPLSLDTMMKRKALKAKKALLHGTVGVRKQKVFTKPRFYLPKTLKLPRNPKYPRRSAPREKALDQYQTIKYTLTTESAMKKVEEQNTLVFVVHKTANKNKIKLAVKSMFNVGVCKVNTIIRPDGEKKAFVKLVPDCDALDVANKIGII